MGLFKRNGCWFVFWRDSTGRQRQEKAGPLKQEATALLHKREQEKYQAKILGISDEKLRKVPLIKFTERYLSHSRQNKSHNMYVTETYHTKQLNSYFSGMALDDINAKNIEEYKESRLKKVSPTTVNRELTCLTTMLNRAKEWGLLREVKVKIKKMKEPAGRVRYLSVNEEERLMLTLAPHMKPIVIIALHTGMRKGEIMGLRWSEVDFENELIHVMRTKNGKTRQIPMSATAKKTLEDIRDGDYRPIYGKYKQNSALVFCGMEDPKKGFTAACKRAKVRDFTFHDLRHTFASRLVMKGQDLFTLQALMGHATLEMTRRYSHLEPFKLKAAICILDGPNNGGQSKETRC